MVMCRFMLLCFCGTCTCPGRVRLERGRTQISELVPDRLSEAIDLAPPLVFQLSTCTDKIIDYQQPHHALDSLVHDFGYRSTHHEVLYGLSKFVRAKSSLARQQVQVPVEMTRSSEIKTNANASLPCCFSRLANSSSSSSHPRSHSLLHSFNAVVSCR